MTVPPPGPPPSALATAEYVALRGTIALRGTARMVLAPAVFAAWAALGLAALSQTPMPLAALFPLALLAAGFEAILALHSGVERVGRYLQVFVEEARADGDRLPAWETTAMASAPGMPGGSVDPLFTPLFVAALIVNLAAGLPGGVTRPEGLALATVHLLVLGRLVLARRSASGQRARDLEHFRRLRRDVTPAALDRHPSH